jgi:beta-galactosidase
LSGIFRDVDLIARPKTFISDFFVKAVPDNWFENAKISIDLNIDNRSTQNISGLHMDAEISGFSAKGERVDLSFTGKIPVVQKSRLASVQLNSEIRHARLWSAETPDLYHLVLKLKDGRNKIIDKARCP